MAPHREDTRRQAFSRIIFCLFRVSKSFVCTILRRPTKEIAKALAQGTKHKGFAFFHIYTNCVTFDKSFKTWGNLKQWCHPLPDDHDPTNFRKAMDLVLKDDFCLGVLYIRDDREKNS